MLLNCVSLNQACQSTVRKSTAHMDMMEESHRSCHCDPRGSLAGMKVFPSLLRHSSSAEPLGMAASNSILHGRKPDYRDNVTLKLILQRRNFQFTCFPPHSTFSTNPWQLVKGIGHGTLLMVAGCIECQCQVQGPLQDLDQFWFPNGWQDGWWTPSWGTSGAH